jgi:hypothetical protein
MKTINYDTLIACVRREIKMREKVYPGRVAKGKMTEEAARQETEAMRDVLSVLIQSQAEAPESLFAKAPTKGPLLRYLVTLKPHIMQGHEAGPYRAILEYVNGVLSCVSDMRGCAAMATEQMVKLPLPATVDDLIAYIHEGNRFYDYTLLKTTTTQQRIAAFCAAYDEATGNKFDVSPRLAKKWHDDFRHVDAAPEVLAFYMQTQTFPIAGPKGIDDYLRHYDAILELMNRDKVKALNPDSFPAYFDQKLYNDLGKADPSKLTRYKQHLKGLGYSPKQTNTGHVIWIEKQQHEG